MFKEEDRAWDVSDIGGMDKYILLCLAHRKNGATQLCCPSIGTIMRDTGVCKDTVRKALKVLVAKGYVTYTRNPGGKTEYQLSIPGGKVDPVGKSTGYESTPGEGGKVDPEGVEKSTPNMEVNKELNKEGENPLPPPSPLARRKTHLFDLEELPPEWKTYCEEVRPDLDPDKVFTDFSFYWSSGRGSGTRRSDKGWAASWQTWVRREKEAQRREVRHLTAEERLFEEI